MGHNFMALKLEFINVVVPIAIIRSKLGDSIFEAEFSTITDWAWHDNYLYREGCMNEYDLEDLLARWEERGFKLFEIIDGKKHWQDICVVNSGFGPSYPCQWLDYDQNKNIAWLKGHDSESIVGPTD